MIGLVSRENNDVIIAPSSHATSDEIAKRAVKNVEEGAKIYHDDWKPYNALNGLYSHESVNHSQGEYSRDGKIHTNTIEAEFSVFRPWIATYRGVSKERLYLYCSHYQFLRETRTVDTASRTSLMLLGFAIPAPGNPNEHCYPSVGGPQTAIIMNHVPNS